MLALKTDIGLPSRSSFADRTGPPPRRFRRRASRYGATRCDAIDVANHQRTRAASLPRFLPMDERVQFIGDEPAPLQPTTCCLSRSYGHRG